jgi:hypothetical protein
MGDAAGLSAQIVPTLSSLDPASLVPGDGTSTVTIPGSGFTYGATVTANGVTIPANYVSATSISVPVPPISPSDVPRPLAFDVAVTSPTGLRRRPPGTPGEAEQTPKTAHPYFWAPFILIGAGE